MVDPDSIEGEELTWLAYYDPMPDGWEHVLTDRGGLTYMRGDYFRLIVKTSTKQPEDYYE